MKFVNDNPAPPKEVTVTLPFDEFMAVMHLIGNSNRVQLVEDNQFVTEAEYNSLTNIYGAFFDSEYYKFYRVSV